MFEIKCDVKGCAEREPVQPGLLGGGTPAGWRIIQYEELRMPQREERKDPTVAIQKFANLIGGNAGKAYEELLSATMQPKPTVQVRGRHLTKHVCPRHPMLEFADEFDGEAGE